MKLIEEELSFPVQEKDNLIEYFKELLETNLQSNQKPVRFVVSNSINEDYKCEVGILETDDNNISLPSIFDFQKRPPINTDDFNAAVIIPTGVGAEIGGHAGDANRVIRLIGSVCDNIVTHPNTVNAADINEMPNNCLYVEGSILSRFLMGTVGLRKVRSNKILVIADDLSNDSHHPENKQFTDAAINAVSAARATLGLECSEIILMDEPILMESKFSSSGRAVGEIRDINRLNNVLKNTNNPFDAIAITSVINIHKELLFDYNNGKIVNPWGGVEAMLTHYISSVYDIQSAHSPMLDSFELANLDLGVVDPRMAAEAVTLAAFHCVLKGLHKSPKVIPLHLNTNTNRMITSADISCLITPDGCFGLPHLAAIEQGIPVVAVKNQQKTMNNNLEDFPFSALYFVENYLEAIGIMQSIKEGISVNSIRNSLQKKIKIKERTGGYYD